MTKRLIPTGSCHCGCGDEVANGSFFAKGHDKVALAAWMALKFGSTAEALDQDGYGAENSVVQAAVDAGLWKQCPRCSYKGAPASVERHRQAYH